MERMMSKRVYGVLFSLIFAFTAEVLSPVQLYAADSKNILKVSDNVWLCDARVDLDDLNEAFEAQFPNEDFDSLGGFVFDLFGKVPVKYEKVSWNDYDFIVQDMEGHRINMVKIIKNTDDGKDDE